MKNIKQVSCGQQEKKSSYMSSQDIFTPMDSQDTEYHLDFLERIESDIERDKISKQSKIEAKRIIDRARVKKMKTLNITKAHKIMKNKNKYITKIASPNRKRCFMVPDIHERQVCTAASSTVQNISSFDSQRKDSFTDGSFYENSKNKNDDDSNDEIQNLKATCVTTGMQK